MILESLKEDYKKTFTEPRLSCINPPEPWWTEFCKKIDAATTLDEFGSAIKPHFAFDTPAEKHIISRIIEWENAEPVKFINGQWKPIVDERIITIRDFKPEDICNGFLETLDNLSPINNIDYNTLNMVSRSIKENKNHIIIVAEHEIDLESKCIIGAVTLLVEQKFIHEGGKVGHIEDVSVKKGFEGNGVGNLLIKAAIERAKSFDCYKVILDCLEDKVGFYSKNGFHRIGAAMRIDL